VKAISTSAPVALRYSRGEIGLSRDGCDKLLRRVRHLDAARQLTAKVAASDGSRPVELTQHEKGFLVVAIKAWMEDVGRHRVPGDVLRLRQTLLGDLYYPVEAPEPPAHQAPPPVATAAAAPPAPARPKPDPRLARARRSLERQLKALEALDDDALAGARAALETAVAELAARQADSQNRLI
jgi:hypothetical protein